MKKMESIISIIFTAFVVWTVGMMLFVDKNISYPTQNMLQKSNLELLPGIIIILGIGCILIINNIIKHDAIMYITLGIGAILLLIAQFYIVDMISVPLAFDFEYVYDMAYNLYNGGTIDDGYFYMCPNNLGITYLITALLKITGGVWLNVVKCSALSVNLSVLLAALIVYKLTENRMTTLLTWFLGAMLLGLSWRMQVVYTDSFGMLFAVLALYIYAEKSFDKNIRILLSLIICILGSQVKVTVLIIFIGIILYEIVVFDYKSLNIKNILCWRTWNNESFIAIRIGILCILLIMFAGDAVDLKYGYKADESRELPGTHYFMMGQNPDSYGVINSEDPGYSISIPWKERKETNIKVGLHRIAERGIKGNLIFYSVKNLLNYNDGMFSLVQTPHKEFEYEDNWIADIMLTEGKYFQIYAFVEQSTWVMCLVLVACSGLINRKENITMKIIILGITLYVLLFEGRAKYLYMFTPIYLAMAGDGWNAVSRMLKWRAKKWGENEN